MDFSKREKTLFIFSIIICVIHFRIISFNNDSVSPTVFDVINCSTISQNDVDNKQILGMSEIIFSTATTDIDRNKKVFAVRLTL